MKFFLLLLLIVIQITTADDWCALSASGRKSGTHQVPVNGCTITAAITMSSPSASLTLTGPSTRATLSAVRTTKVVFGVDTGLPQGIRLFVISVPDVTLAFTDLTLKTFTSSLENGGAIHADAANIRITLTRVEIADCIAGSSGGAIFMSGKGSVLVLTDSTFTNNVALDQGGAVSLNSASLNIFGTTTFHSNKVTGLPEIAKQYRLGFFASWIPPIPLHYRGGAINLINSKLDVSGTGNNLLLLNGIAGNVLESKPRLGNGGGLSASLDSSVRIHAGATLHVSGNMAIRNGGGLHFESQGTRLDVFDSSTFLNVSYNAVKYPILSAGGGISFSSGSVLKITAPSIFQNNMATVGNGGAIGVVDAQSGKFLFVLVLICLLFIFWSFFKKTSIHSCFIFFVLQLLGQGNCVTIYLKIPLPNSVTIGAPIKLETIPSSSMTREFDYVANAVTKFCIPCGQYENIRITPTLSNPDSSWTAILSLGLDGTKDFAFAGSSWYDFSFHNIEVNSVVDAINPDTNLQKINLDCAEQGVTLANAYFIGNRGFVGGALSTDANSQNTFFKVDSSTFEHNTGARGGAVFLSGVNRAMVVTNSKFYGNRAFEGGGISLLDNAGLQMYDTVAYDNHATLGGGGFLHSKYGTQLYLENVDMFNNHAEGGGGGAVSMAATKICFRNVSISRCSTNMIGGGAVLLDEGSDAEMFDSSFTDNRALDSVDGGHFMVIASSLVLHDIGSVLKWPKSEPVFPDTIDVDSSIGNVLTKGNSTKRGGSVSCQASSSLSGTFKVLGAEAVITGCSGSLYDYAGYKVSPPASQAALALLAPGSAPELTSLANQIVDEKKVCVSKGVYLGVGTVIKGSVAEKDGGAISATMCNIEMEQTIITESLSNDGNGGAIFLSIDSILNVRNHSVFEKNTASNGHGGAVACNDCKEIKLDGNSIFSSNTVKSKIGEGGAVYVHGSPGNTAEINSKGSIFSGNTGVRKGGVVSMYNSKWNSIQDTFEDNQVTSGAGGAFYLQKSSVGFHNETICRRNRAMESGGGCIYWNPQAINKQDEAWHTLKPIVSSDSTISDNQALYGQQLATSPFSLLIDSTQTETTKTTTNNKGFLDPPPNIDMLDQYNQIIRGNTFLGNIPIQAKLKKLEETNPDYQSGLSTFGGTTIDVNQKDKTQFDSLGVQGIPGSGPHTFTFEANIGAYNMNSTTSLQAWIKNCEFFYDGNICNQCPLYSIPNGKIYNITMTSKGKAMSEVCLCISPYYLEIKNENTTDTMVCTKCPTRSTSLLKLDKNEKYIIIDGISSSSKDSCTCDAGLFEDDTEECESCPANSILVDAMGPVQNACACNKDYYAEITGTAMTCQSCPPESFSLPGATSSDQCICKEDDAFRDKNNQCRRCSDNEYVQFGQLEPTCVICPRGADCKGLKHRALFGWSQCRLLNHTYEKCLFPAACKGAANPFLEGRYTKLKNGTGIDPAKLNQQQRCAQGYKNNSVLCAACAGNYSRDGKLNRCNKCPEPGTNIFIATIGIIAAIVFLFANVRMSIGKKKGKARSAVSGAKSIGLSFIQVLSMIETFPIAWSDLFLSIFQIGGVVSVLGESLVNVKCMYNNLTEADVFWSKNIVWGIFPLVLPLICLFIWGIVNKAVHVKEVRAKIRITLVTVLYIIWPGICRTAFEMFACQEVCGISVMRIDLDEKCWVGRHATFISVLGIPMILLYVLGLPLFVLISIKLMHDKALRTNKKIEEMKGHRTWGRYFSMFRKDLWWWEGTVAVRKIMIVTIGVFGTSMGTMQVHLTGLCIVIVMLLTVKVQPFGKQKLLMRLEMSCLFAIWLTLWAGGIFNAHPRCEDGYGRIMGWCNLLSILIGLVDIGVVLSIPFSMVYLFKQKKKEKKARKKREYETKMRSKSSQEDIRFRISDLDMMVNPSVSIEMAAIGGDGTSGTSSTSTGNGEVKVDEEWKRSKPSPLAPLPSEPPARGKYKKKTRGSIALQRVKKLEGTKISN